MMNGILRIQTYRPRQSAPVEGVTVVITGSGFTAHRITDAEGNAEDVAICAPACALSLDENNTTTLPYAVCSLTARKPGYRTVNTEQYLELTEKYGGIIVMIPHYANYEWLIGMGAIMKPGDVPVQVYKPLRDKYLDELFKRIRSRFGGYNIPKHSTAREIIKLKREGKKMVVGLITDQWPSGNDRYWTTFLGQETAFLNGAERIAKMMNFPVFYCELTKKRRGYCEAEFKLMTETPKNTAEGEITEMFARYLEQTIRREPAYWLWSHKRWKASREEWADIVEQEKERLKEKQKQ